MLQEIQVSVWDSWQAEFVVGHVTVLRILHEQLLYPYHLASVHCLTPADQPPHENYCRWFVQPTATPLLVSPVLFIDEATFVRDGIKISTANICEPAAVHDQCVGQYCGWVSGRFTCCALMPYIQCLQQFPLKWSSITVGKYIWQEERDLWMTVLQHIWAKLYKMCTVILVLTNGEQDAWPLQLAKLYHLWRHLPPSRNLWKGVTVHDQMCPCALI